MRVKLANWYKIAKIKNIDQAKLENREKVILSIIKKKPIEWLLDCLRIYFEKPLDNAIVKQEIVTAFTTEDSFFPQTKNELEVRILSGAIVYHYCTSQKNNERTLLLQAFNFGKFGMSKTDFINYDLVEELHQVFIDECLKVRENVKIDQLAITFDHTIANAEHLTVQGKLKDISVALNKIVGYTNSTVLKKISILEEESNIHWWIFRGQSDLLDSKFSDIGLAELIYILSVELCNWTVMAPGPLPAKRFISKILSESGKTDKESTIKELVAKSITQPSTLGEFKLFGNLSPILHGLSEFRKKDGKAEWLQSFKHTTGIAATTKHNCADLSFQLYNELVAQRFLN